MNELTCKSCFQPFHSEREPMYCKPCLKATFGPNDKIPNVAFASIAPLCVDRELDARIDAELEGVYSFAQLFPLLSGESNV